MPKAYEYHPTSPPRDFPACGFAHVGETRHRPRAVPMVAAHRLLSGLETAITEEHDQSLGRLQRRLLRRIYNGRTVPLTVDGKPFLTYKEASRYLLSLTPNAREKAYAEMRSSAALGS